MFGEVLNADELLGELDELEAAQAAKELGDLEPQKIIKKQPAQSESQEEEEPAVAVKPKRQLVAA